MQQREVFLIIPGNVALFEGISSQDLRALLECIGATERRFKHGETILSAGQETGSFGIIAAGSVQIVRNGLDGTRLIVAEFGRGQLFAESFVCAGIKTSPVTVTAAEDSVIILIPFDRMLRSCGSACNWHVVLIGNMMRLLARRNLLLNNRLEVLSKRTIREKVIAWLRVETTRTGSVEIIIPFSRGELADFLGIDRSALSRELGRMEAEGLIRCAGKQFTLLTSGFH